MYKRILVVLVCVLMLSAPVFSQTESETDEKGRLFFAVGFYNGFFGGRALPLFSGKDMDVTKLNPVKAGAYWEMPKWNGYLSFGLEGGFGSGSKFGGHGGTDFIPLNLSGAYAYPVTRIFSIGPSLKAGILGGRNSDWFTVAPLLGARLEAELRFGSFPLSIYGAGGVDFFPASVSLLPMAEVGLRFPRGAVRSRDAGTAGQVASGQSASVAGGGAGQTGSGALVPGAAVAGAGAAGQAAGAGQAQSSVSGTLVPGAGTVTQNAPGVVTPSQTPSQGFQGAAGTGAAGTGAAGAGIAGAGAAGTAQAGSGAGIVGGVGAGTGAVAAAGLSGQTRAPVVTAITVNPPISTVTKGQAQSFGALISGNNNPSQSVNWTVSGGGIGTTISPNGVLTVAPNESATNLTVRATSTVDPSKSATATVAVNSGVTAVAVNPPISTVTRGQAQPFGAIISGSNNPAQSVNWSVSGGGIGTTINSNGILTVAPSESATNLTVRATSTADPSKSATAVVALTGAIASQGTTPDQEIRTSTVQRSTPAPVVNFEEHHRPGFFRAVYFEPDSAILIEDSRHIIEGVGQQMAADPGLRVVLRSFTAPFGTAAGREMVSGARVNFCRDYLIHNYRIAADRIATESWASERLPENAAGTDWVTYRCVEFIVSGY